MGGIIQVIVFPLEIRKDFLPDLLTWVMPSSEQENVGHFFGNMLDT